MNKMTAKLGKGILLRGSTYWYRRMVDGKHLQISLHTADPVEALRIATDIKNTGSVTCASAKKAVSDTLDDQIKRYIDGKAGLNKHSAATNAETSDNHSLISESEVTTIQDYYRERGADWKPKVTQRVLEETFKMEQCATHQIPYLTVFPGKPGAAPPDAPEDFS